ncbi:MAG: tRNA preQ1(34) S-adenosylmethionine ribosyltransferase-isomerase QueA [Cyanobacteria bacterium RM1_2_2]|nr:tRNA preQ1(34) S-adenosylmethionine ribosyltransferase-isomerase QueA [Cyanobacteria bacterium RM1_2_2]
MTTFHPHPTESPTDSLPSAIAPDFELLSEPSSTPHPDCTLEAYDYHLPDEQIAQNPVVPRDTSRLLVVDAAPTYQHRIFRELPNLLQPGDLLVLNNTRVIPARLYGRKTNGTPIEVLLLEEQIPGWWLALVKPGKRLQPGAKIEFGSDADGQPELTAIVMSVDESTGGRLLQFSPPAGQTVLSMLAHLGKTPLPPYITESQADPEQYQTVYAKHPGSAAAPTAGLHFTPELLDRLAEKGIEQTFVTLHVGVGTFRPVEAADITEHQMHAEWIEVSPETVAKIQETKARGGRVIAVGTTSVRSLEGAAQLGELRPYCGKTNLFIYPGYRWNVIDGLITNFHLPKSSLLMLVSALIGRERLLELYQTAIEEQYRFYSFGDAMLVLPEAKQNS